MEKAAFYANARTDLNGPMHGIRVLDVTTAWAGPMVSCMLADFGADVIRVTAPGDVGNAWPPFFPGSERSPAEEMVNRNKRSVSIDLRTADGAAAFLSLVETVDIVVENFKPGTLTGWGVGYEACAAAKPDLVFVSVSGYGQYGPNSALPGYDPAGQAFSGWMSLNGDIEGAPTRAPTWLADDLGGLHGALGALAALRHRDQTGEGQHVDVALVDSIFFQSNAFPAIAAAGITSQRMGSEMTAGVPVNTFECIDGHIFVALILDAHWRALCTVMGRDDVASVPGWTTNSERVANRDRVNAVVSEWCGGQTIEQALAVLGEAGVVASIVHDFPGAVAHPHYAAREMMQTVEMVDGNEVQLTGPAAKFSRTPTKIRHGAPVSNQHTDEILTPVLGADEVARLREAGAIT